MAAEARVEGEKERGKKNETVIPEGEDIIKRQ